MYKRLRIYYLYVALPFLLLLLGAAIYFDAIKKTIVSNPHPQINYAIFVIILIGGVLIIRSVFRLMNEARALAEFSEAVRGGADRAKLQSLAINYDGDIAYVLRMIAASSGRAISAQEQAAIEHELDKASSRMYGRNALPQFLTGLLVGMGLLGTFIGLLSTLTDISTLISSFADIDMGKANPVDVFRNMIQRMRAPMQSMGIAFSASLFGLLGSIILGMMMVGIRRCLGDILSLLGSEVAQHIEFALASEGGFAYSKTALKQGFGKPRAAPTIAAADVVARPPRPAEEGAAAAGVAPAAKAGAVAPGAVPTPAAAAPASPARAAVAELLAEAEESQKRRAALEVSGDEGEGVRILARIEDRLAESARLQLRALTAEIDDFTKQRGDMLRALAENTEAATNFRGELQRVGRQLGTILGLMEKGNGELMAQLSEMMVRGADESAETRKLLAALIEQQRMISEALIEVTKK